MIVRNAGRRQFVKAIVASGAALASPALIGRAKAATRRLRLSNALANDPKYGNGRVYYDLLVKHIAANGLQDDITVQFFPDNQLGSEMDVINSVKLGVVDIIVGSLSTPANLVASLGVYDLGYLFQSFEHQTKVLDAGAAKFAEDLLKTRANITIIGWQYNFGARSVLCKTPVSGPADLAGKKIRTLPSPIVTECLKLMGAAATPMAFGEIYTGLQAGVLDGLEQDPPTILAGKFYESAKFYSMTQHIFMPLCAYMSSISLSQFAPKIREGFLDAAQKAALDSRKHGLAVEGEALQGLRDKGVTILECDREAFRKRVQPQTDAFAQAHPDAKPVIDLARSTYK